MELTPRISEDRESPELPPAAGTKPLPLRAPVGRLPILGTWRSQKTKRRDERMRPPDRLSRFRKGGLGVVHTGWRLPSTCWVPWWRPLRIIVC